MLILGVRRIKIGYVFDRKAQAEKYFKQMKEEYSESIIRVVKNPFMVQLDNDDVLYFFHAEGNGDNVRGMRLNVLYDCTTSMTIEQEIAYYSSAYSFGEIYKKIYPKGE